jgi:RNA polymerase sigma-70 factor (ECF subfamily)
MTTPDDRQVDRLVRRAVKGDTDAFGRIYDLYADRIYGFVRSRLRNAHDAEDVTEIVFLKAFEAIGKYDRRGIPFGAWLFRIARNAVIDYVRREGRTPDPVEDLEAEVGEAPTRVDEEAIAAADGAKVRACIAELTEDQAGVVACRFLFDMDIRTTARVLGRTEGAVKALQHRALRNLSTMLAEMDDR